MVIANVTSDWFFSDESNDVTTDHRCELALHVHDHCLDGGDDDGRHWFRKQGDHRRWIVKSDYESERSDQLRQIWNELHSRILLPEMSGGTHF